MRVCSECGQCFEDQVFSCTEGGHLSLKEMRRGTCEMVAGYSLERLLESGLKGEIYRGRHITSRRTCLVKILTTDAQHASEFLREAQVASALFHPNVMDVYESGTLDNGDLFVITENADGQTVRELLDAGGSPELMTSITVMRQAAEAVHAIHLKGLTHRALSPENIVVTTDGEGGPLVRINNLDLGGVVEHSIISNKLLIDSAIGSIRYFSPEQCLGDAVGIKSDVYSLGVVLFEMLAGVPPFGAATAVSLIEKHKNERPPEILIDNFDLRMLVANTLMESLTKWPERRQSSANAFARQLRHIEQLATHESTPPPAVAIPPAPPKPAVLVKAVASGRSTMAGGRAVEFDNNAIIAKTEHRSTPRDEPVKIDLVQPSKAAAEKTAEAKIQSRPASIAWTQPEDDIPSLEDVLEVLSGERITAHPPEPATVTVTQAEPEEIAAVATPGKPIRIDLAPLTQDPAPVMRGKYAHLTAILGDAEENETAYTRTRDSIWSAFSSLPQTGFSVDRHSLLMIGSGFIVLTGIFFLASVLISDFGLAGGTSDSAASTTMVPQVAQTDAVSPPDRTTAKNLDHAAARDVETSEPKPLPAKDHAPLVEEKPEDTPVKPFVRNQTAKTTAVSQKIGNTPTVPSIPPISTNNGKTKSKTEPAGVLAGKKTPLIIDRTAGATRPRIVIDPRP